jgi:predicted GNAT superfamily acetyltransferase
LAPKVLIRKLRRHEEFDELVPIQRTVWNHTETNLTPAHQFCIHIRMGAILIGAFVDGKLAGFVYSFPALHEGVRTQHSHLLAVLPEYQGFGLGKRLKEAQRREALKQGVGLITWTFDPMQARNANLNLHALGVRSRTYLANFYGPVPSLRLGPGLPTDRLLVEWRIGGGRSGGPRKARPALRIEGLPAALERGKGVRAGFPMPARPKLGLKARRVLVEIPCAVNGMKSRPDVIGAWQAGLRRVLPGYFARKYSVVDFVFGERCFYVLER